MTAYVPLKLETSNPEELEVFANASDLRQDLHAFLDYARTHEIKRGHRDNLIPKAHQQRLITLMSDPASAAKLDEWGISRWIHHVDSMSLKLKLISYDTEGVYMGYSSSAASYPDNFIKFHEAAHNQFLKLSLQAQEERILDAHLNELSNGDNEFFHRGPLNRLDQFDQWGSATGVVPTVRFPEIRKNLLKLLAQCPGGIWFSTASLIEHLRVHDPWFLIPKVLPAAAFSRNESPKRYGNFIERKRKDYANREPISDKDPEGFAKVEGRFVERFLEGIPLVLGYTEVAYARSKQESAIEPSRGMLSAFRVTERLLRAIRKEIGKPKITVLPNFEVHVESLFFPGQIEAQLRPLGDLISRGIVTVFKLTKPKVAAALAAHPEEKNALETLEALSGRDLPPNVAHELNDWAGHSEKFILYEGFGLLEGRRETAGSDPFVVEEISPNFALVRSPEKLYRHLEAAEQVPLRVRHPETALVAPANARSQLAPSAPTPRAPSKERIKVKRSVRTTLWFAEAKAHAAFCKILLDAKMVVSTDSRARTVTYPKKAEPLIHECLQKLKQQYTVALEDVET